MGYAHYWYRQAVIEKEVYAAIVKDFRTILKDLRFNKDLGFNLNLAGADGEGKPVVANWKGAVVFNGLRMNDQWHESFNFFQEEYGKFVDVEKYADKELFFRCCKTDRKPYDIAVTTFLVIAKHHLGDKIVVESNGGPDGFNAAVETVHGVLGYRDFYLGDDPAAAVWYNPEPKLQPTINETREEAGLTKIDGGDVVIDRVTNKYSVTGLIGGSALTKDTMNRIMKEYGEVKGTSGGFPLGPMLYEWHGTAEGAEKLRELGVEVTDWN